MPQEFKVKNGLIVDQGGVNITGSSAISGALSIVSSGSSLFTVDGTAGRLFSVDDSLSGSLFSVNTIAGLPVMEAFSDNTVRIGQYGKRGLYVSQSFVGIGKETALNASLDVSGSLSVSGSVRISLEPSASSTFRISSGSNTLLNVNSPGRLWLGNGAFVDAGYQADIQGSLFARGQSVIKAQSYNESVFQIQNADGVADWVFYNNDNNPNGNRIFLRVPNFSSTTPITIGGYENSPRVANAILIGGGTITSHGPSSIRMGFKTNSRVGTGSVSIGSGIESPGNSSVHIGTGIYNFLYHDNAFLIGGYGEPYTTANSQGILAAQNIFIGRPAYSGTFSGNVGNAVATSLNGMGAYGVSDGIGGDLYIAPGAGLGTGSSGDLIFSTYNRSGSSGFGYQTVVNRWWIKSQSGTLSNSSSNPSGSILYVVTGSSVLLNISSSGQQIVSSPLMTLTSSNAGYLVSQSLVHSGSIPFTRLVGVNITPSFTNTTSSQTQTALRVSALFTGSASGSNTNNIVVDFGTQTSGSMFVIDDVVSGSVYTVNDFFGLPVLEVMSDAQVNMYDYPYAVFNKSASYVSLGLPSTFAVDSAVYLRADTVMDEGFNFTNRVSQGNGTTLNDSTASLYTFTFGTNTGSAYVNAVVTGYDSASRATVSGEIKSTIKCLSGVASIIGTNFRYINAENAGVNIDLTVTSNTFSVKAYGTGSRTYVWGATVTTQVI